MLWPVYEFRPLPDSFRRGYDIRRYAEGAWVKDDGEYDLAFVADGQCFYFEVPYRPNILCSWLTTHWSGSVRGHPRGNPWHYALRKGESGWGDLSKGRDAHPNELAGRSGMTKICSERGGAGGFSVKFDASDPIIAAGLLRERDTKNVFGWPDNLTCMYCGTAAPVNLKADAVA